MKKLLQNNPSSEKEKIALFEAGRTGRNGIAILMKLIKQKLNIKP